MTLSKNLDIADKQTDWQGELIKWNTKCLIEASNKCWAV